MQAKPDPKIVQGLIVQVTTALAALLIEKNQAYGNSALDPVRVFSKADALEQINVRIDDKLSRIARGLDAGEGPEWDLMGYLVLKRIGRIIEAGAVPQDIAAATPPSLLGQEALFDALGLLIAKIEECGGSTKLTDAVMLASDIRAAIGNRWNQSNEFAAKRVLDSLSRFGVATTVEEMTRREGIDNPVPDSHPVAEKQDGAVGGSPHS